MQYLFPAANAALTRCVRTRSAGKPDKKFDGPGVIFASGKAVNQAFVKSFIAAIAQHRFPERADLDLIVA